MATDTIAPIYFEQGRSQDIIKVSQIKVNTSQQYVCQKFAFKCCILI